MKFLNCIHKFQHKNYILFKISASDLFFNYFWNFANFSLDILVKYILIIELLHDDTT